ncbi:Alpha-ketoglutarate-dependent 2,4-dichlorophenoxyacetate dioxygenase [Madurella mycetomatis]|uniref:Alpha-ketoglutarate-dependent 2,4-dichlorophenoxyacetate dioxygenase n=1 Tax=Madurella mycetomatis TaxID=100816 RepID=A0A175WB00_9PEZI|nr:Alpha-ketoglutarate-dependent 2,4-dichlorophenoxyacetate dioxygenase [Madurella mycetomatis]
MSSILIQDTPYKTLSVKEIRPDFGAEVSGVDFEATSDEQIKELLAVLAKYAFTVHRSTPLTDDSHIAFSRLLGSLDDTRRFQSPNGSGPKSRLHHHPELFDASNLAHDGSILPPSSPRAHANKGNAIFHVDSSFNPLRSSFSLLRAVALPPAETGGRATEFADSRRAWEELPDHVKRELTADGEGLVGAHCMAQSRKLGSPEFFAHVQPDRAPMARHRVVQTHAPSGRGNLYVGAHLHHFETPRGERVAESNRLVEYLNGFVGQDKYVVRVEWQEPGDLVIWDNRAVLHRAPGNWEGEAEYVRDLRRTTVHDDGEDAWGLNVVGTPMPTMESWAGRPAA